MFLCLATLAKRFAEMAGFLWGEIETCVSVFINDSCGENDLGCGAMYAKSLHVQKDTEAPVVYKFL
jgi:hypothetical protein